ncbi:class I SAM-dependent methyltransferase [Dactylosporangium maewongense]|uniref:Class I SAM-dependent methyltransferase n=1 Tax=Dactylosporangium maewongense TaxID=634393 RepID=A0ABP4M2I0_9ACTN
MTAQDRVQDINQQAWDHAVDRGDNPYTHIVSSARVAAARRGDWSLTVSEQRPVPRHWLEPLAGARVLCLASGGGQQAPILAAAGAAVTVVDLSSRQLDQDRFVADRDGLEIATVQADMADLSALPDQGFDLLINPVSTLFVPDLTPVWAECHRVLVDGGALISGFLNPDEFVFDSDALDDHGVFVVKNPLPYSEIDSLSPEARQRRRQENGPFHFSHTMEAQIGGVIAAGFTIDGFYEDRRTEADGNPIRHFMPSVFVMRARKV